MSIETRTQQSTDDIAAEGREPDARQDAPAQVAYDKKIPDEPVGDALPLDGGLTLNDEPPQDQTESRVPGPHTLAGSEGGGTANVAIEGGNGGAAPDVN